MKTPMFATIRKYRGTPALVEELVKREEDIQFVLTSIPGFQAYYLLKSDDGALSVTVCESRAGAEESNRVASAWLKDKLPTFATHTPEVTIGELQIHLGAQPVPVPVKA